MAELNYLCFLLLICIVNIQGQFPCRPFNVVTSAVSSTELLIKWTCQDGGQASRSELEYQVEYQLTNLGQCDTGDGSQQSPFDIRYKARDILVGSTTDDVGVTLNPGNFRYSLTLSGLLPYSTYRIQINSYSTVYPGHDPQKSIAYQLTSEAVPTSPPTNIRVEGSPGYNTLTFAWDDVLCMNRHGDILSYWYQLAGRAVSNTNQNMVTFSDLLEGTTYTFSVAAVNGAGTGPAGRVTGMTLSSISLLESVSDSIDKTSLRFSWTEAQCTISCPDGIRYSYRLRQAGLVHVVDETDAMMVTISDLMPCTTYAFSVAVKTANGIGSYGPELEVTTADKVPGEVIGLSALSTSTHIVAEWQSQSGPCVTGYMVEHKLINVDQCNQAMNAQVQRSNTSGTSTTIGPLDPYSTYEVSVRAVNGNNEEGPASTITVVTLSGGAPTAAPVDVKVTSNDLDSLSFSWGEVPCGSRHGEISQYNYQLLDQNDMVTDANHLTSNRFITIDSGLMQCRMYKFRVRAVASRNIVGPYSESITAMTSTPVTNLNAESISSTELGVSWEAPTDACTTNVEYNVEYRITNRGQCQPKNNKAGMSQSVSITTVTLSDLHPYSAYEIQVRATGGVATLSSMTGEAAPSGPPADVNVTSTTNTTIEIGWNKPICTERNGNITGYTYSWFEDSSPIIEDMETTDTKVLFTDLTPSTSHTFSISAKTNIGNGPSYSFDITTLDTGNVGKAPNTSSGSDSTAAIVGAISGVIILILLVVIVFLRRRQPSPLNKTPAVNVDVYDEIDPNEAKLSAMKINKAQTKNTGYEVNLAMDGIKTESPGDEPNYEDVSSKTETDYQGLNKQDMEKEHEYQGMGSDGQVHSDGADYEDVNNKTESDYQGLNTQDMVKEHEYQGMRSARQVPGDDANYEDVNTKHKESDYQGLNVGHIEREHEYQDVGNNPDPRCKTSSPYVNVP